MGRLRVVLAGNGSSTVPYSGYLVVVKRAFSGREQGPIRLPEKSCKP